MVCQEATLKQRNKTGKTRVWSRRATHPERPHGQDPEEGSLAAARWAGDQQAVPFPYSERDGAEGERQGDKEMGM